MTKYESPQNVGFKRISAQVERWMEEIDKLAGEKNAHQPSVSMQDRQLPTSDMIFRIKTRL